MPDRGPIVPDAVKRPSPPVSDISSMAIAPSAKCARMCPSVNATPYCGASIRSPSPRRTSDTVGFASVYTARCADQFASVRSTNEVLGRTIPPEAFRITRYTSEDVRPPGTSRNITDQFLPSAVMLTVKVGAAGAGPRRPETRT